MPIRALRLFCFAAAGALTHAMACATGVLPDTTLLVISESDGNAQMGVLNTDEGPLLVHTTIVDLPEDKDSPSVFPIPPVIRVEGGTRQIVRFVMAKDGKPLKVQHLKRVIFEGIPVTSTNKSQSVIQMNVRQDLPVVISPEGLEQDPEPWKKIEWRIESNKLSVRNPSPFVARLSPEIELLPGGQRVKVLPHAFVLPGDALLLPFPEGIEASSVKSIRLQPASPYGFALDLYEVPLIR